jgi:NAD(P)-dependent dehydrogenase (short-subunit alcohol dehydrogenase family)
MQDVIIVTGGSQGIGAAIARATGAAGYKVALTYQSNQVMAEAVAAEIGNGALAIRAEMADEASILSLFRTVDEKLGPLTALVNNAGTPGPVCKIDAVTSDIIDTVLAVNVRAPFLTIREAAKRMATDQGGSGGSIVNISSRAAELGGAGE